MRLQRSASGWLLVLNLLLPAAVAAQGGPPLRTDDPGTPGPGHWEINTALTIEKVPGQTAFEAPLADINYGIGERVQLKLEAPLEVVDQHGASAETRLGNPMVGVKWRFLDRVGTGFAVSTYPQLELVGPSRTEAEREADGGESLLLPIEAVVRTGPVAWNAEVGYRMVADAASAVIYGLVLGHDLTPWLELAAECNGESDSRLEEATVVCSLGARESVNEHFTLLGALGRGISGPSEERPTMAMYLGLQSSW
ncbi:MAG TPA: hypothetical protein VJQ44_07825 [Gemmatimonadales bacterium]|nr:hypothetical protein [Gemmatimonadales bacterium]